MIKRITERFNASNNKFTAVSEYQTLGYQNAKERAFAIGTFIACVLGILCFIVLFFYAPIYASKITGDSLGGNTIEDILKDISLFLLLQYPKY